MKNNNLSNTITYYVCEPTILKEHERCLEEIRKAFFTSTSEQNGLIESFSKYLKLDAHTLMAFGVFISISMVVCLISIHSYLN